MVVLKVWDQTLFASANVDKLISPEHTSAAAQAFEVAMASDLATRSIDLANTVSHLPLIG